MNTYIYFFRPDAWTQTGIQPHKACHDSHIGRLSSLSERTHTSGFAYANGSGISSAVLMIFTSYFQQIAQAVY